MLASTTYPQDYIDACRARVADRVDAYGRVAQTAGGNGALDAFEPSFFAALVLELELSFVHRLRKHEGKDGNPLNEVRLLATSIVTNDGVLVADKNIKLTPATSVLGLAAGDPIRVDRDGFTRLADAFFADIEAKYGA